MLPAEWKAFKDDWICETQGMLFGSVFSAHEEFCFGVRLCLMYPKATEEQLEEFRAMREKFKEEWSKKVD